MSFLHEHDGLPVTPWNPGLGMLLAIIILKGRAWGGVLLAGVLLAELLVLRSALPFVVVLGIGAIVALAYTAVADIARRHLRLEEDLIHPRDIVVLLAAGLAGAIAASALLSALLVSVRHFDMADIARTAVPLVLGDVIGIVVVTPLVLRARRHRAALGSWQPAILAELALLTAAVVAVLLVTMRAATPAGLNLFYLLFLPVVVAAVRHGIDGACAALAIVQLVLVTLLHLEDTGLARFTEYQVLMLVLTLTGLVVGAVVSERQVADERARSASERLRRMQSEAARAGRLNLVSGMAAALAHEINQPLTAARAFARSVHRLLREAPADLPRAEANAARMIEQIDHAGAVVKRMREFLQRGEPHVSTLEVAGTLAEAAALAEPLAAARAIRLEVAVPPSLPPVFADRVQIQQVVLNLVSNAVEAIAESGRRDGLVRIAASHAPGTAEVVFAVEDNGIGIAAGREESVFEPLSTSRNDGIGLGLAICRAIVESHQGRIWLAASQPGRTLFHFTLPARPVITR